MADVIDEFDQLMAQRIKKAIPQQVQWAKVRSVNWDEKTCEAMDLDSGLPFYNVSLGIGSLHVKPKIDSLILVGLIENSETKPFLLQAEEIEAYEIKTHKSEWGVDEKFFIKNESETLTKLMSDLINEIRRMKFTTNTGSTIQLINEPNFAVLETRFKTLLKDN